MNNALMKKWMKENNLRAEDVASKLGISYPTVREMMAGKKPRLITIKALSQWMGVTEQELLQKPHTQIPDPEAA